MDNDSNVTAADVARTLETGGQTPRPGRARLMWIAGLVVAALAAWFLFARNGGPPVRYVTQEVTRGAIMVTVTATGTLQPTNEVDIGSELSGTIRSVNVDFNDTVEAGQVLAVLDTSRLLAQELQAKGSLASAEANVLQTAANLREARANLARLEKVRELSDNRLPSQQDMDVALAAVERAEAAAQAAKAAVAQARANLEAVQTDLQKAEIRSPINGVVLVRSVEPGATVAASFQAPVLFTLAEDLKKMQLRVDVDEADVGKVREGQDATFTVDAYPERQFSAKIISVRYASSSQTAATGAASTGVVTYETVLEVDNSELLLRPGMTATAQIVVEHVPDALLVPNAALRFTPPEALAMQESAGARPGAQRNGPLSALMPSPRMRFRGPGGGGRNNVQRVAQVWVMKDGAPQPLVFRPGATDGRATQVLEVLDGSLEPGTAVIVNTQVGPVS